MSANLENSAVATGLEKISFHSNPKERQCQRMFELPYSCAHFTCQQGDAQNPSSKASTVWELGTSRFTSWIQKSQRNRCQIANTCCIIQKSSEFQKSIYFCFIDYSKAFDFVENCGTNCGKFLKRWKYQTALPVSCETYIQVKKQQLELDMKQQIGSKLGKEYIKAVYCHPAYLTYMQSASYAMPGWMNHKLESRLQGEISIISNMQMTPPYVRK